jgi:hypothetical protein
MSEAIDGDGMREPEYAERKRVSAHERLISGDGSLQGGVGGASGMRKSMGATTVDMMANTRILEVACHVDILITVK